MLLNRTTRHTKVGTKKVPRGPTPKKFGFDPKAPGSTSGVGSTRKSNNMNNPRSVQYAAVSRPFQKTIGLAFHVEEIHPE